MSGCRKRRCHSKEFEFPVLPLPKHLSCRLPFSRLVLGEPGVVVGVLDVVALDEKVELLEGLRGVGSPGLRGDLRGDADDRVKLSLGSGSLVASGRERGEHRQDEY